MKIDSVPEVDFVIERGGTFQQTLELISKTTKEPIDITDCSLVMKIRTHPDSISEVLFEISTDNDRISITDALLGKAEINVIAADTAALEFDHGYHDLLLIFPDAGLTTKKLYRGCVKVRDTVSV